MPLSATANRTSVSYAYDESGQIVQKSAGGGAGYYLRNQSGRELATINDSTDKVKTLNLYGFGKIGRVDVARSAPGSGMDARTDVNRFYFCNSVFNIFWTLNSPMSPQRHCLPVVR